MKVYDAFELPPDKQALHRRAVKLEWVTILFFATAVLALGLTLGQSQAMKAAWIEDMLGFVPPVPFLVAARYRNRPPDENLPYGYHRSVTIAFLSGSVALFGLGGFVVYDSVMQLVLRERPPIGMIELFGHRFWLGWLMIVVLALTMVPAILLGRVKVRIARELHDKVLYSDAEMNRADWLTAGSLRIREEGHVFAGELLVVPASDVTDLVPKLEGLGEWVRSMDWRMHDLVVAPVTKIEKPAREGSRR